METREGRGIATARLALRWMQNEWPERFHALRASLESSVGGVEGMFVEIPEQRVAFIRRPYLDAVIGVFRCGLFLPGDKQPLMTSIRTHPSAEAWLTRPVSTRARA